MFWDKRGPCLQIQRCSSARALSAPKASARERGSPEGLNLVKLARKLIEFRKKYSASKEFWHKNRGIPRMKPLLRRLLRVDESLSTRNTRSQKRPTRGLSRPYALSVGYLSFCARIGHFSCTFSKGEKRRCRYGLHRFGVSLCAPSESEKSASVVSKANR